MELFSKMARNSCVWQSKLNGNWATLGRLDFLLFRGATLGLTYIGQGGDICMLHVT